MIIFVEINTIQSMKNFFYSLPVSLLLNLLMIHLTWTYWSLPMIVIYSFFLVFYTEKAFSYRKLKNKV